MKHLKELLESMKLLKQKPAYLALSILSDAAFLFMYGLLTGRIFEKLLEQGYAIGLATTQGFGILASQQSEQLAIQKELLPFFGNIILLLLLLGTTVYLAYSFFQGASWTAASRISKEKPKTEFATGIMRFFTINLPWFALFSAHYVLDLFADLRHALAQNTAETIHKLDLFGAFLTILLIIICYFAITSYAAMSTKKGVVLGIKKAGTIIPAYIFALLPIALIEAVLRLTGPLNSIILRTAGVVMVLGLFCLARVHAIRALNEAQK